MLDRQARVFTRIDAFDEKLQRCRFSQAVDEFPGHRRILHGDAGHVDSVVHLPLLDRRTSRAFMARRARPKVFGQRTQIGFTVAAGGVIDG